MPGSSDDERDSRTAAVGVSNSNTSTKRRNRTARKDSQDADNNAKENSVGQDDAASSSRSQSPDSSEDENTNSMKPAQNKSAAINWNQASRSTIRTTLGKKNTASVPTQAKSSFDTVNDKYFRSRSDSESEDEVQERHYPANSNGQQAEDDQSRSLFVYDSEGSGSGEISEGGDSMMLNIGQQDVEHHPRDSKIGESANGSALARDGTRKSSSSSRSKAAALAEFSSKYKVAPTVLADLNHRDLQIQARYFFNGRNVNDLDLSMPISCTECLENGHLALVCPSKEVCYSYMLHCYIDFMLTLFSVNIVGRGIRTRIGFVRA